MSKISGSLLFRHVKGPAAIPKDKKLMMVMGTIIVDEDFSIKSDTMVRVKSGEDFLVEDHNGTKFLAVSEGTPLDKKYSGWSADQLFTERIWRA